MVVPLLERIVTPTIIKFVESSSSTQLIEPVIGMLLLRLASVIPNPEHPNLNIFPLKVAKIIGMNNDAVTVEVLDEENPWFLPISLHTLTPAYFDFPESIFGPNEWHDPGDRIPIEPGKILSITSLGTKNDAIPKAIRDQTGEIHILSREGNLVQLQLSHGGSIFVDIEHFTTTYFEVVPNEN